MIFVRYWKCNTLNSICEICYRAVCWNHVERPITFLTNYLQTNYLHYQRIFVWDHRLAFVLIELYVLTKNNFDNSSYIPNEGDCTPLEISILLISYDILVYIILFAREFYLIRFVRLYERKKIFKNKIVISIVFTRTHWTFSLYILIGFNCWNAYSFYYIKSSFSLGGLPDPPPIVLVAWRIYSVIDRVGMYSQTRNVNLMGSFERPYFISETS